MHKIMKMIITLIIITIFAIPLSAAGGGLNKGGKRGDKLSKSMGPSDRKYNIHDGNRILTIFRNYGSIGEWQGVSRIRSGIYPQGSGHSYFAEFSPIVGAEVINDTGTVIHIFSDGMESSTNFDPDPQGQPYRFEPEPGYANPDSNLIAMSDDPDTWPAEWPGKPADWDGLWNGQYGKYARADQESYFVMTDFYNDEFLYHPVAADSSIRGIGVEVEVRGYQWVHPAAEDILIWTYWVTNKADVEYEKVIFGMYGDADVGDDGDQRDDDASWDVDFDMVFQWDHDMKGVWGGPPAYFGYKFLESPGDTSDGIDNDGDGMIDESQFDGIDNDGDWNAELDDVGGDGIGPDHPDYTGPDDDGSEGNGVPDFGEPNFEITDNDESDQIGLTSFRAAVWPAITARDDELVWVWTTPGADTSFVVVDQTVDLTFLYGSGYFPMAPGTKRKFAIAMLFGEDLGDIKRNAGTMQKIYDADYSFAKAPNKPIVSVVPGDGRVTLYWDDSAELSRDPIYGYDFEGYRIYRATDPKFLEGWEITDAYGHKTFNKPVAIFDIADGLTGPHPVAFNGIQMDMGEDSGLTHSWTDSTVENGQNYYYAVTAFDMGYYIDFYTRGISEVPSLQSIEPSECSKIIDVDPSGVVLATDDNTVAVTPDAPAAGYMPPSAALMHNEGVSTATVKLLDIIDPRLIDDESFYEVSFDDTSITNQTLLSSYKVAESDTEYFHEGKEVSDVENLWNGFLFVGPYKLFMEDVEDVRVDSVKWSPGDSILKTQVTQFGGAGMINELALPRDLEIQFFDRTVDSTIAIPAFGIQPKPVNFLVVNRFDDDTMRVFFSDSDRDGIITSGDNIAPMFPGDPLTATWQIDFTVKFDSLSTDSTPSPGSVLYLYFSKPLESFDKYRITGSPAVVSTDSAREALDKIAVVPNPYVVAASWEPQHFFSSGRGRRKLDFIHLPQRCTIKIFNMRGHHIRTIEHDSTIDDGSLSWDMLSKDGLEIAFGVYVFHVSAPGLGEQIGKFAVIK